MNAIKIVERKKNQKNPSFDVSAYGVAKAKNIEAFHASFPEYEPTPLVELKGLAKLLGVKAIYVKDESYRFGLNAFKVLGGSYAIGSYLARKNNLDDNHLTFNLLQELAEQGKKETFVTATDGNHGRGIAWTCNRLKQKAVVLMPHGSSLERLTNIQKLGADASITDLNYDDAVRLAYKYSEENGWVMVQDTAWEGYEKIPQTIMQGYTTMAYEAVQQLGDELPTHVFLQAGVGAMSGAAVGLLADFYQEKLPIITIVEPDKADCLYQTALANDGNLHFVGGKLDSIMAGLCCGEPCTLGWEVLASYADFFVSMPDEIAAEGMRLLASQTDGDPKIISGESGAAGAGLALCVLRYQELASLKVKLGLDENSVLLFFSTEGDTDQENYQRIVKENAWSVNFK
ncbi:MAG: diaminopropionate ammonia-lyase [Phascolarctobacterium sp.]|nr:diaminopropionate ammonia-lyase [Phascolarctobacterium sp.]